MVAIYNRADYEREASALDDDSLYRLLIGQQGAVNALAILLKNGCTRTVAQDMVKGLESQMKFAASLAVSRGIATTTQGTPP